MPRGQTGDELMKRFYGISAAAAAAVALAAGCVENGLSLREEGRQTYTNYLYSEYDPAAIAQSSAPATQPTYPIRVAVAQVGEVSPPLPLVERLRKETALFARVEGIP